MITVSGLHFIDNTKELPFKDRMGAPDLLYGLQLSEIDLPLPFQYLASDTVSSFVTIRLDNLANEIETISLSTSLISSDGTYHKCDGLTKYATFLNNGVYYFKVNDRYESDVFGVIQLKQGVGYDVIECTQIVYP